MFKNAKPIKSKRGKIRARYSKFFFLLTTQLVSLGIYFFTFVTLCTSEAAERKLLYVIDM